MRYSNCKEIDREVKRLVTASWKFFRGGKHGKLFTPSGVMFLTVPCTPSDSHSFKNFLGDVRRVQRGLS